MDLGNVTVKDVLTDVYGDEQTTQILSELQEGIDKKLPVDELRQKAKAAVGQAKPINGGEVGIIVTAPVLITAAVA